MAKRKEIGINYLWPDPDSGPWDIRLVFRAVQGTVRCVGMGIYPSDLNPPKVPLTSGIVKNVPFAELLDRARLDAKKDLSALIAAPRVPRPPRDAETSLQRAGRPRIAESLLREVATVYLQSPTKPTTAVAEHFEVPVSTAAKWVSKARQRGLLEPTTPGKAGGAPGAASPT